ncbi:carboxypeptidase-like regulatory domain-containing protein [Pedobacter nototheniae]|uniref:carboxypeptidase-like regulatory domain-containing protein n=1 Tax=Pedobacter nototheniae TaxID=2488994 RepID=UPI00292DCEFA|nr:carboxypeptidase-like regulatory domain-containing protein [Pedobacter nototheniae]
MKPQFKIIIPESCNERWNDMTANEAGRFCDSCQKSVIDFTGFNDQDLRNWFIENQGKGCGRFRPEQLGRFVDPEISTRKFRPGLIAASIFTLLSFSKLSEARAVEKPSFYQNNQKLNFKLKNLNNQPATDSLRLIKGKIIDKDDKSALPGVSISLGGTDYRTTTNSTGEFLIRVPADFNKNECSITINYIGYKSMTSSINLLQADSINLELCASTEMLGGAQIMYVRNPSIWERLRQLFSKKVK